MVMYRCCNNGAVYRDTILTTCPYSSSVLPTRDITEKHVENLVKCSCPRAGRQFYNRSVYILKCFEKCKVFKEYWANRYQGASTIPPSKEILPENCKEITIDYERAKAEINTSSNSFMKDYLEQHIKLIEARTDFSECAKAARRKILVQMWQRIKENGNSLA